jgi:hypothetical protein
VSIEQSSGIDSDIYRCAQLQCTTIAAATTLRRKCRQRDAHDVLVMLTVENAWATCLEHIRLLAQVWPSCVHYSSDTLQGPLQLHTIFQVQSECLQPLALPLQSKLAACILHIYIYVWLISSPVPGMHRKCSE